MIDVAEFLAAASKKAAELEFDVENKHNGEPQSDEPKLKEVNLGEAELDEPKQDEFGLDESGLDEFKSEDGPSDFGLAKLSLKKLKARLRNKAMYALARREHSCHEMMTKLTKVEGSDDSMASDMVNQLKVDNLISDQRFAEAFCRSKFIRGVGPVRLRYELNQHHIDSGLLEDAMAEYDEQWLDRLLEIKERKYGSTIAADYKTWAKRARFLQSRGFSSEQINSVLERPRR